MQAANTSRSRPILFSSPMVRAILAGTKTQTRRVVQWRGLAAGLNPSFSGLGVERIPSAADGSHAWVLVVPTRSSWEWRSKPTRCPFGQPGDRLWVREAWAARVTRSRPQRTRLPLRAPRACAA